VSGRIVAHNVYPLLAHGGLHPPGPEPVRLLGCCGHRRTNGADGIIARIGGGTARTPCLMRHRCNMKRESLCISKDLLWILIPSFPGSNPGAPVSKCGLGDGTSRYGRTRDISAIRRPEFAADWDATVERVMKGLREALGLVVDAADGEADGVAAVTRLLALPTLIGFRACPHGVRWPPDHCPRRS
jgi:hypothetical protein